MKYERPIAKPKLDYRILSLVIFTLIAFMCYGAFVHLLADYFGVIALGLFFVGFYTVAQHLHAQITCFETHPSGIRLTYTSPRRWYQSREEIKAYFDWEDVRLSCLDFSDEDWVFHIKIELFNHLYFPMRTLYLPVPKEFNSPKLVNDFLRTIDNIPLGGRTSNLLL